MPNAPSRPSSIQQPEHGSIKITHGIIQPKGFPGLPPSWVTDYQTWRSADDKVEIFGALHHLRHVQRGAEPAQKGHRALIISHGLGEHGGRYLHFAHYLQDAIDVLFCPDHRGHGRSSGRLGHVDQWSRYAEDFALAIRKLDSELKERYGKSEIHALGHSMGSLILLGAAFEHPGLPLKSLTISSPLFKIRVEVPLLKRAMAGTLSRIWGTLQMGNELAATQLSHDPEVAEAYRKDRLVHAKITPRLYTEMIRAIPAMARRESGLPWPLLAVVPLADPILDPEGALDFYRKLKIRDKQLKTYPGFYHEAFNEVGKEQVFEDLREWIKKHSGIA